jgi:ubiquinone/menaquinone biosynthesis C-methylase UbiE
MVDEVEGVRICLDKSSQVMAYDTYERYELLQRQVYTHLKHDTYDTLRAVIMENVISEFEDTGVMVDLGCGIGAELYKLSNKLNFEKYVGVDSSNRFLNFAYDLFRSGVEKNVALSQFGIGEQVLKYVPNPKLEFCLADATDLPFVDNSVNLIISYFLFDRVKNPEQLIFEISRVLSGAGVCILATPFNFFNLDDRLKYVDVEHLNSLFNRHDLFQYCEQDCIDLPEPIDESGNFINWKTRVFYLKKKS